MSGCDGKLCFSEKKIGRFFRYYVERIMNVENDCDHDVEGDAVGSVDCIFRDDVVQSLNKMKMGKSSEHSDASFVVDC